VSNGAWDSNKGGDLWDNCSARLTMKTLKKRAEIKIRKFFLLSAIKKF
jgi:hypothetical protein